MKINQFYKFGSKQVSTTFTASLTNLDYNKKIEKLICGDYNGIEFPLIFLQDSGKNLRDLLDTGFSSFYLISNKFKDVLIQNNLTGWNTYPVKIFDRKKNEISGYHGFSINGRCGPIDYRKCKIIESKEPVGQITRIYKGLHIGLEDWDGTDFFLPEKTTHIIVSSKTANLLKKYKLTNISLRNLEDIETPDFALKILKLPPEID